MPIYEKRDDAGAVVERSVAFLGTDLDAQLSHAAANQHSPWQLVDANGEPAHADPTPAFVEPPTPDAEPAEPAAAESESAPTTEAAEQAAAEHETEE